MVSYDTRDRWSTSHVEDLRNEYVTAIKSLDVQLEMVQANIERVQSCVYACAGSFTAMIAMDWSSEGQFETDLEAAAERWKTHCELVITRLKTAVFQLETKRATMWDRRCVLEQMCRNEDLREEEYTSVPFGEG